MHHLHFEIYTAFQIKLPSDFSPWDMTVEEIVTQIEQIIDQESADVEPTDGHSDVEIRCRVFDEIATCLAKSLGRDKEAFQLTDRFQDVVPWYRRGQVRKMLIWRLDKKYSWLFAAEPGCVVVSVSFLIAGLSGAVFLIIYENPDLFPCAFLIALACHIISGIVLDKIYTQPFSRFSFRTIADAVDTIVKLTTRRKDESIHKKYQGNREAILNELLRILTKAIKQYPQYSVRSKLKVDLMKNYKETISIATFLRKHEKK